MEVSWLMLAVMVAVSALHTYSSEMKITPKRASTNRKGSVELMCDVKVPVVGCSFKVYLNNKYHYALIDIKLDSQIFNRPNNAMPVFSAKYYGQGLDKGQCGLKMFGLTPGLYFVGCRVRTATSGWTYDHMALLVRDSYVSHVMSENNNVETDFEIVQVDSKTRNSPLVHFAVKHLSRQCQLLTPPYDNFPVIFTSENVRQLSSDKKYKVGWNVTANTIDVTLFDVTSSGVMWCLCRDGPKADFTEFDVKIVNILKPPETPELTVVKTNYAEGETLTATCVAKFSRPVARIVWKLGDDVIRNDTDDDNVDDNMLDDDETLKDKLTSFWPWRWPWSQISIKQVLKHPMLTLEDNGKKLTCQALHPALANGSQSSESVKITVQSFPVTSNSRPTPSTGFTRTSTTVAAPNNTANRDDSLTAIGGEPENTQMALNSTILIVVGVILGVVLVVLVTGAAICWLRRKPDVVFAADQPLNDRTSFVVDNDLYQSEPSAHFVNRQAPGPRVSYEAVNPYDQVILVSANGQPLGESTNVLHYEEVIVGPTDGSRPPPRKPCEDIKCAYAEVTHS